MPDVVFLTRILTHYRVGFHEAVRQRLAEAGVRYRLGVGSPTRREAQKADMGSLDWAEPAPTRYLGGGGLVWQSLPRGPSPDLLIIGQENKILSNYALQVRRRLGARRPALAFFGHGKNFQAADSDSRAERFKRLWIDKVDWWFAYTERSADIVAAAGFPREKITVFNNAIDTSAIQSELASIGEAERTALRARFGGSDNIGIYIGGLYDHKRVPFLIEAAKGVRRRAPDFQLLVIGGGPDAPLVRTAAAEHDWIHALGPKFGREKTLLASLGKVFLMPGLVGLGVLDSFAYGLPMVTTAVPYHSPEIDYLQDGANGVVVREASDPEAYAQAVARVLTDAAWRARLRAGALAAAGDYTVEAMAERFAAGVVRALNR